MHVGIDLDNTLICYDRVFGSIGVDLGILPASMATATKLLVREHIRGLEDGERQWMRLQGQAYGRFLERAELMAGAAECLRQLRDAGARISIVSHKTRFGHFDEARINLHDAATAWLESKGFFAPEGFGFRPEDVCYALTREEKIAKIAELRCDIFIDDLPEVLLHPMFPAQVRRILFGEAKGEKDLDAYGSWASIASSLMPGLGAVRGRS